MLKNNHGITLSALIVTIIIIMILAGVTVSTSDLLLRDTKAKAIISNMYLVKGKVESMYDDYAFNESKSVLVGINVEDISSLSEYGVTATGDTSDELWYIIDSGDLLNLGMDKSMLPGNAKYIVNYETGEVIYSLGVEDITGEITYKLSEIEK